jgi:hypothetical protein
MNTGAEMSTKPLPAEHWSLWKLLLLPLVSHGALTALLALYPTYSTTALVLGFFLTAVGTLGFVLTGRSRSWWGRVAYFNTLLLLIMAIGVRAWLMIGGPVWIWTTILIAAYVLAWTVPILNPKLSELLWKEQIAPETRLGQGVMNFSITFLPLAGAIGASIGMYGSRSGHDDFVALFIGTVSSIVSIALAQAFSHQLWQDNPWRERLATEAE